MKLYFIILTILCSINLFAVENIIDCNDGRFHIMINQNDDETFTYIAFDQKTDSSKASLILNNGSYEEGKHSDAFIFKKNFHKYTIYRMFDGAGGEIGLIVERFGKEIFREICHKSIFN